MNKCPGCGATLQSNNPSKEGYYIENKTFCERCFRIKHYNEYLTLDKDNSNYIKILEEINKTDDLVVLVVDLFNIEDLNKLKKYIDNDTLLVITKRDLFSKKIYEEKLLNYFDDLSLNIVDKIIISSNKNYHMDELKNKIKKYQKSNNVYVVGYTNAGKSTMINKLIYNYSTNKSLITTSNLPSTTLDLIEIKLDDNLTLYDTPGILIENSLLDIVDSKTYKKLIPKSEIKPLVYQVKILQSFVIEKLVRIDVDNNDLIFYINNNLNIERFYKEKDNLSNLEKHIIEIKEPSDIVIKGLGFIKITKKGTVTIYVDSHVGINIRKSLI